MNDLPCAAPHAAKARGRWTNSARGYWAAAALAAAGFIGTLGCTPGSQITPSDQTASTGGEGNAAWRDEMFRYAIDNLNRMEEFEEGAILRQIVDRLNHWLQVQAPIANWKPDPLLATLPETFVRTPDLLRLDALDFQERDGLAVREAIWMRDVGAWARGKGQDDLSRARALFDWTVCNVQLMAPVDKRATLTGHYLAQSPWETLLLGQGTARDRAWVFLLLCRQQGIPAAVLTPETDPATRPADKPSADCCLVGVLVEGKVYLFDTARGLPIPAPHGIARSAGGALDVQPATLEQAAADDSLLRQLDAGSDDPYPLHAAQLQNAAVWLEGSPACLSQRMKLIESHVSGPQRMVLAANLSAQAQRWKAVPHVAGVRLWTVPYETLQAQAHFTPIERQQQMSLYAPLMFDPQRQLWKGRMAHVKGILSGEEGAAVFYKNVRVPNEIIAELRAAARAKPNPKIPRQVAERNRQQAEFRFELAQRSKQDASYWLGVVAYQRGDYADAVDYLSVRSLEVWPEGPRARGSAYLLGRCYEALGQRDKAAELFRTSSRLGPGEEVRAKWLKQG